MTPPAAVPQRRRQALDGPEPGRARTRIEPRPRGRLDARRCAALNHLAISCSAVLLGLITSTDAAQPFGGAPVGLLGWVAVSGMIEATAPYPVRFGSLPFSVAATLFTVLFGPGPAVAMLGFAGAIHGVAGLLRLLRAVRASSPRR